MNKLSLMPAALLALAATAAAPHKAPQHASHGGERELIVPPDSLGASPAEAFGLTDTIPTDTILRLTEDDYKAVAEELGIEVATMKAVTEIEAGRTHQGFWAPGKPLANFDITMFRKFAARNGINLSRYQKSHPGVFRKRGSGQAAVTRRFEEAATIDRRTAIEGVFWGMFQIGGFNWKLCGCKDIEEFYTMMCRSERDQLELFARFVTKTGLVKHLRTKNWAAFARGYNGPGYAARGYHTKLANAYARHRRK